MGSSYDVAIIGAGASGLAAAQELCKTGLRVALVEARDRIGGRVYTLHPPEPHYPVELGAEFIHGVPAQTWDLIEESGLLAYEVSDNHWIFSKTRSLASRGRKRVQPKQLRRFWKRIDRAFSGIPSRGEDRSFREFAESNLVLRLSPRDREMAVAFVEGFNGASQDRISAQSLASSGVNEAVDITRIFRLASGYDQLLNAIWRRTATPACSVILNSPIREIRWERGAVELVPEPSSEPDAEIKETIRAQQLIVTLPAGVLASGSVRFTPDVPEKFASLAAIGKRGIEMGSVFKLVLRFNHVLWEELGLSKFGFVHAQAEDSAFPTWWNASPMQVPLLTGWAGGPAAGKLAGRTQEEIEEIARYSLSRLFSIGMPALRRGIEQIYFHDWQADPYARGAYSYVTPGGLAAPRALARPLEDTLYFAGEATLSSGMSGTVDGAISTGRRAAREAMAGRRALELKVA